MQPGSGARGRGFTLIELMIVVAIIAVLAMVVVPNIAMSKSASNQTAAIASLRVYAAAQIIFKRNDCDMDNIADFADEFRNLYYAQTTDGQPVKLVPQSFANADAPETSVAGYYYEDLTSCPDGDYDHNYEFGLAALPAKYNRTGVNSLVIDCSGVVYEKDRKTGDPLGGLYPSIELEGWAASGR